MKIAICRRNGLGDVLLAVAFVAYPLYLRGHEVTFYTSSQYISLLDCFPFLRARPANLYRFESSSYSCNFNLHRVNERDCDRAEAFQKIAGITDFDFELPTLELPADLKYRAERILKRNVNGRQIIAVAPISDSENRTYCPENLLELLGLLQQEYFVILAGKDNWHWGLKNLASQNLMPILESELVEVAVFLSFADKAISVDSGLMHLLGLLKKPTIALFGSVDPRLRISGYPTILPVFPEGELSCIPCYDTFCVNPAADFGSKCMKIILPERILRELELFDSEIRRISKEVRFLFKDYLEEEPRYPYFPSRSFLRFEKRLLVVIPQLIVGGGEIQLEMLLKNLKDWETKVVVVGPVNENADKFFSFEYEIARGNKVAFLRSVIQDFQPSVILFHAVPELGRALRGILNRPAVFQIVHLKGSPWSDLVISQCYDTIDEVITVAKWLQLEFSSKFPSLKFKTIWNGARLRGSGGINYREGIEAEFVLGILARFSYEKRILPLLEVIRKNPSLGLLIGGWGKLEDEIRDFIGRYNLSSRVKILGIVEDLKSFFDSVDAAICFSSSEGNSVFLIEAALAGKPIISTRVGAVEEIFGLNFFPISQNGSDLLEACKQVKTQVGRMKAQSATEFAKAFLSDEAMARQYEEEFLKELERRSNPSSVLVQRFGGLGDILMSLPALKMVKEKFGSRICYLTSADGAMLLKGARYIDEIVTERSFLSMMRDYDWAIDLQHYEIWDTYEHIINFYRRLMGFEAIQPTDFKIELDYQIEEEEFELLPNTVFLASSSNLECKNWGMKEDWENLKMELQKRGFEVEFFNGEWRGKEISPLAAIKLLSMVRAIVTVDSFAVHAAKAAGIPAVVIYGGSSSPEFCGYPENLNLVSPEECYCKLSKGRNEGVCNWNYKCLKRISWKEVLDATLRILNRDCFV